MEQKLRKVKISDERIVNRYIRSNDPIPESFAEVMRQARAESKEKICALQCRLYIEGGWSLRQIGKALGNSGEWARTEIVACSDNNHDHSSVAGIEIPKRQKETITKIVPAKYVSERIDEATIAELQALRSLAKYCRGAVPPTHPAKAASIQYAARLNDLWQQGYSVYGLAKSLGVTTGAVQRMLVSYGYKESAGKSKAYQLSAHLRDTT